MKSFIHMQRGTPPRQAHTRLDGLKDDELGRDGFSGRSAQLYRRNDPTSYRAEGRYRLRALKAERLEPTDATDPRGEPLWLFRNDDCRVLVSKRREPMPYYARTVDGDLAMFVHRGTGRLETEFGPLDYEPGDYLVVPKAVTYRVCPGGNDTVLLVVESTGELAVPDYGPLGRHAPFDPTLLAAPEPEVLPSHGRDEWEVRVQHGHEWSSVFYPFNPCDVEAWKGDLFPFRFNIRDWCPILSDRVHLPPSVHFFLQARGLFIGHFLPRPAEREVGVERVPWYHRNADYDEVALYHGGDFLGAPLRPGLITFSPQGLHHGAPEAAREHARATHTEHDRLEWQIIAIDAERPLTPNPALFRDEDAAR